MLVEDKTVQGYGLTTSKKIGKSRLYQDFLQDTSTRDHQNHLFLMDSPLADIPNHTTCVINSTQRRLSSGVSSDPHLMPFWFPQRMFFRSLGLNIFIDS